MGSSGAAITVSYTTTGTFTAPYTAYISNDNFVANKTAIGTGTSSISATIPSTVASGTNYRIRVEATGTSPTYTDNGADLTVVNYQTNEVTSFAATAGNAQVPLTWTNPTNCFNRIVVVASTGTITAVPGGTFTANAAFGSGTDLGGGQFVVYDGTGSAVTVTGLTNGTLYNFKAFTTNGDGYSSGTTVSATPVVPPATLTSSASSLSGFTASSGTASTSQSYVLTGSNLPANGSIRVTLPASSGYEISTDNTTYSQTATITYTGTTTPTSPLARVYVRLAASTPPGTYNSVAITNTVFDNAGTATTTVATVTVSGSVVGPVITITSPSPATLTGFSTTVGTASAPQTYNLSAANLGAGITVTAANGYEVAQSTTGATSPTAAGYSSSFVLTSSTTSRKIWVRLAATTPIGTYGTPSVPFYVTNASTGATTQSVAVDGVVTAIPPVLTASPATLNVFNTLAGTPSTAQTYNLTGSNLTSTVSISAPTGFEISAAYANGTNSGGYFASLSGITAAQVASPGATISVRLAGGLATDASSSPSGSIANTGGGVSGARNVAVSGTVVGTPAPAPAPTVAAGTPSTSTVTLTLGAGAGTNLLVVVRPSTSTATAPTTGTAYSASTSYGAGATLGAGSVVYAAANTTSITVTDLTPSTSYVADVYTYNVGSVAGFENYQSAAGTSGTFTTAVLLASAPGMLLLEEDFDYSANTVLTSNVASGWRDIDAANSILPITTTNGNLSRSSYPRGAVAATPAGTASMAAMSGGQNAQDIYRVFSPLPAGSTTLYVAALINVSAVLTGDNFLTLYNSTSAVFRTRIFIKPVTGGFNIGINPSTNTLNGSTYSPTTYSFGNTYLVVIKYENSSATGNTDATSMFVLPATTPAVLPTTEPTPTVGPLASTNTDFSTLNAVVLRQAGSSSFPTLTVDNLRVGTGWGTAIGRPVYTAATASIAAGNYYDVTINNGSTLTPVGAVKVEGNNTLNHGLTLTSGTINTSAANSLTLYPSAGVTGGNSTSFVNGPLNRLTGTGAATSLFPIGSGTFYRPITLNVATQTNAVTYTASQTEGNAGQSLSASNGLGTAPLQRVSYKRFYTVTPNVAPTGFSGTITLSFGAEDYVNTPADPGLVVAKRDALAADPQDNNKWTNLGHSAESGTASGPGGASVVGTITSATFTGFSDFALGATNDLTNVNGINAVNPLPVQLSSFGAQRQAQQAVAVKWTTATEKNAAYFEVQRSLNTRDFVTVATAKAQGTSSRATAYTVLDQTAPAAALYYRLRQVDADGTVAFSPVVVVAGTGEVAKVLLYPNPTRGTIHFITEAATPYRVLNQLGQALLQGTTEAGTATVDASTLPVGLYFLELQTPNGRNVQKFEKQ